MKVVAATVYDMSVIPFRRIGWQSFPPEWLLRTELDLANNRWRVCSTYQVDNHMWTVYVKPA